MYYQPPDLIIEWYKYIVDQHLSSNTCKISATMTQSPHNTVSFTVLPQKKNKKKKTKKKQSDRVYTA